MCVREQIRVLKKRLMTVRSVREKKDFFHFSEIFSELYRQRGRYEILLFFEMKNLLYVLSIVAIWTVLLYFFLEIYFQHPSISVVKPIDPSLRSKTKSSSSVGAVAAVLPIVNLSVSQHTPFKPLMEFYQEKSKNFKHLDEIKGSSSRPLKSMDTRSGLNPHKSRLAAKDYRTAVPNGIPWKSFVEMAPDPLIKGKAFPSPFSSLSSSTGEKPKNEFVTCSKDIEDKLKGSLSKDDYQWCEWALSEEGGKVKVSFFFSTSLPLSLLPATKIGRKVLWKLRAEGSWEI
jgi:hypothetical protein